MTSANDEAARKYCSGFQRPPETCPFTGVPYSILPQPPVGHTCGQFIVRDGIGLVAVTFDWRDAAKFASFEWGHYVEEMFIDRMKLASSSLCTTKQSDKAPDLFCVTIQRPKADDWTEAAGLFRKVEASFMAFTGTAGGQSYLLVTEVSVYFHAAREAKFRAEMAKLDAAHDFSMGSDSDGFENFFTHVSSYAHTHTKNAKGTGSAPVLAWHGAKSHNVSSIVNNGVDLKFAGSLGAWHGKGFYTTTYPRYAEEYLQFGGGGGGDDRLLLCWLLAGRPYPCLESQGVCDGIESAPGECDSTYTRVKGFVTDHSFKDHPEQSTGDEI